MQKFLHGFKTKLRNSAVVMPWSMIDDKRPPIRVMTEENNVSASIRGIIRLMLLMTA